MEFEVLVNDYLLSLSGRGLAESTVRREWYGLRRFGEWWGRKDVREMTAGDFEDFVKYLGGVVTRRGRSLSARSVELELGVLERFFEYLYCNDFLLTNPLGGYRGRKACGRERKIFSEEEIGRVLDSIGVSDAESQRDRAFFELAYSSGFRAGELCGLKLVCVYLDERVCLVKGGKGGKDRYVPYSEAAHKFLVKYLREGRREQECWVRGEDKEYVFLGLRGRVKVRYMRKRFEKYLLGCGLSGYGYTVHSIRHSAATHLLLHGASVRYVQELLGHESLNTTQVYVRPGEWEVKKVYRMYHPRENEYYLEPDGEYVGAVKRLCEELRVAKAIYVKKGKKGLTRED